MKGRGDPLPAAADSERDGRARTALWGKMAPEGPSLFHGASASLIPGSPRELDCGPR